MTYISKIIAYYIHRIKKEDNDIKKSGAIRLGIIEQISYKEIISFIRHRTCQSKWAFEPLA